MPFYLLTLDAIASFVSFSSVSFSLNRLSCVFLVHHFFSFSGSLVFSVDHPFYFSVGFVLFLFPANVNRY